jgi:hypothetical protein
MTRTTSLREFLLSCLVMLIVILIAALWTYKGWLEYYR